MFCFVLLIARYFLNWNPFSFIRLLSHTSSVSSHLIVFCRPHYSLPQLFSSALPFIFRASQAYQSFASSQLWIAQVIISIFSSHFAALSFFYIFRVWLLAFISLFSSLMSSQYPVKCRKSLLFPKNLDFFLRSVSLNVTFRYAFLHLYCFFVTWIRVFVFGKSWILFV